MTLRSRLVPLAGVLLILGAAGLGAATVARGQGWNAAGTRGAFNPGGMMGGTGQVSSSPISMDRAVTIARQTAAGYPGPSLSVDEVIEFQNNFYALIKERDSGIGAFEVLINRYSGAVSPELGPNMMWNSAYGMTSRGGMMGGVAQPNGAAMTVSKDQAAAIAQRWLDRNVSGATTRSSDPFHGYYTVDFEKGGRLAGMLSVNGYSGQVWLHTWHGNFIQSKDLATSPQS